MNVLNEELIQAWIRMSASIKANRMTNELSANDVIILRAIMAQNGEITAAQLCQSMNLLKSQVNRLVTSLEKRGLIERVRSVRDKRKICISITEQGKELYLKEHSTLLSFADRMIKHIGEQKADTLIQLINEALTGVDKI